MPIPRKVRISFFLDNPQTSDNPKRRPTHASTVSQNMTATKVENSTTSRLHRKANKGCVLTLNQICDGSLNGRHMAFSINFRITIHKFPKLRGGRTILNSLQAVDKWISALGMSPPGVTGLVEIQISQATSLNRMQN